MAKTIHEIALRFPTYLEAYKARGKNAAGPYYEDIHFKLRNKIMAKNCKHCGEPIELDRDTKKLIEDGFVREPDVCSECLDMINNQDNTDESFSDADIGL